MALNCERCQRETGNRKNRYCESCGRAVLRKLDRVGYLQPLTIRTVDGETKLADREFLTLPDVGTLKRPGIL